MSMQMKGRDVQDHEGAVMTCTVADCSYNKGMECWAPEIHVGNTHPSCDTFTHLNVQAATQESCVTECGVTACDFNESKGCVARGVTLANHTTHADCITFRP